MEAQIHAALNDINAEYINYQIKTIKENGSPLPFIEWIRQQVKNREAA